MARYRRPQNIDIQPMDNTWIILDLAGDAYYSLNASARWYLENLLDGVDAETLAGMAEQRYEALSRETALTDIQALISELCRLKLLVDTEAG